MEPRLSLLTLGVDDVARARAFYEALGFVASGPRKTTLRSTSAGGIVLALFGARGLAEDTALADGRPGFSGIALAHNVRSEPEVDEVLAEAVGGGAIVKAAQKAFWGGTPATSPTPTAICGRCHNPDFPFDKAGNLHRCLPASVMIRASPEFAAWRLNALLASEVALSKSATFKKRPRHHQVRPGRRGKVGQLARFGTPP